MATITRTNYALVNDGGSTAFDGTSVWTAKQNTPNVFLTQVNPATGAVLNSYTVVTLGNAATPGSLIFLAGSLWYQQADQYLDQFDPATGALLNQFIIGTSPVPNGVFGLSVITDGVSLYVEYNYFDAGFNLHCAVSKFTTAGALVWGPTDFSVAGDDTNRAFVFQNGKAWVAERLAHILHSFDATTGALVDSVSIPGTIIGTMTAGPGATLITLVDQNGNLYQFDTGSLVVTGPFPIPGANIGLAITLDSGNNVWLVDVDPTFTTYSFHEFSSACALLASLPAPDLSSAGGGIVFETISNRIWTPTFDALNAPFITALLGGSSPASVYSPQIDATKLPFVKLQFGLSADSTKRTGRWHLYQ